MTDSLLPSNATDFERAFDESGAARVDGIDTPIAEASRPLDAPAAFVPFLAWQRNAGFWRRRWSETKQRYVAESEPARKRVKGTRAGIEAYIGLVDGARVVSVVRPPAGFFAGDAFDVSNAAFRAWIRSLPEVRIFRNRDVAGLANVVARSFDDPLPDDFAFIGGADDEPATFFAGDSVFTAFTGVVVRKGVETPLTVIERPDERRGRTGSVYEITWPMPAGPGFFADDVFSADGFLDAVPDERNFRRVAFGFGDEADGDRWDLIGPSGQVQDLRPEIGAFPTEDRVGLYADDDWVERFADVADDPADFYWALRLMEGGPELGPPASFVDVDRFGMPARTAEIVVALKADGDIGEFFADWGVADLSVATDPFDETAIDKLCDAVGAAKALGDEISIDLDYRRLDFARARTLADITL